MEAKSSCLDPEDLSRLKDIYNLKDINKLKDIQMSLVEYFPGPPTQTGDHKCDKNDCSLWGWLYRSLKETSDRGTIVFLHGHEQARREPCAIATFFASHGFIVFAPVRSGNILVDGNNPKVWRKDLQEKLHVPDNRFTPTSSTPDADKDDILNTGKYIDDWATEQDGGDDLEEHRIEYLKSYQVFDVEHALKYLHNIEGVDMEKIGIIGHSYGGSLAVFFAAGNFDIMPKAVASVSGGELSWEEDGPWAEAMHYAVKHRKVPIYFLQPGDAVHLGPTTNLPHDAAITKNHQFQAAIFPPVADKGETITHKEVHSRFIGTASQLAIWAPSVIDFFERYFSKT